MRPRAGLAILLFCLGANAGDFSTRHRLAVVDLVAELDRLAIWCERKGGVDLERDRACELILFFEPDHKQARKLLGFRRDRSGRWSRTRP